MDSSQSSRCMRSVTIPWSTSPGGRTWMTPALTDHGPKPGASMRSATAMDISWCHATFQFASGVLSNRIARTIKASPPSTGSIRLRTAADDTTSRISATTSNRLRMANTAPRRCLTASPTSACSIASRSRSTVISSNTSGMTAKPSWSSESRVVIMMLPAKSSISNQLGYRGDIRGGGAVGRQLRRH